MASFAMVQSGPSPRGRGNLFRAGQQPCPYGAIPAWAGKPWERVRSFPLKPGHPRVGGETGFNPGDALHHHGPSPRGRGNRLQPRRCPASSRAIPAWAGKPRRRRRRWNRVAGHPRVGGETAGQARVPNPPAGPSPRGRGNPSVSTICSDIIGAIPAWAGKPMVARIQARSPGGHPRVGGETQAALECGLSAAGPSPRGRGNPTSSRFRRWRRGAIPAWAGKPCLDLRCRQRHRGHPRVGGETGARRKLPGPWEGPSPRGRGNLSKEWRARLMKRAIPAWAGKPDTVAAGLSVDGGHPRVGGETSWQKPWSASGSGPSPRGRGNRPVCRYHIATDGAIPAWAGKPGCAAGRQRRQKGHPRVGGETDAVKVQL